MGSFYCRECDNIKDSHDGCHEDPRPEHVNRHELLCPDCFNRVINHNLSDLPDTPEVRQGGMFTTEQLAIIKKLENDDE